MSAIFQILNLLGGLGIFLIGMKSMSDGIHKRSGDKLKSLLGTLTTNRLMGVFTGLAATCIVQSSSATTVILVSLVNAGLVNLQQSIGVIMGANIGTTLTAWIVSIFGFKVKITSFALPAVAIAIPFYFSRSEKRRELAEVLIGFGLLFLGLHLMKESVPDIGSSPEVLAFLTRFTSLGYLSIILFVLVGAVLTVILQSSSAAMALTLTMAYKGWIDFPIAAAIVLGENIGTTITAFLASLPMKAEAKRSARAHMVFNLVGVTWMLIVFFPFLNFIDRLVPGLSSDSSMIPLHLSAFHTSFNIANTLLLIWFVPLIAELVKRMIKDDQIIPGYGKYRFVSVPSNIPDAVESNLISVHAEAARMAQETWSMMSQIQLAAQDFSRIDEVEKKVGALEDYLDSMQEELTDFLTDCMRDSLSNYQARNIQALQRVVYELESISDSAYSIAMLIKKLKEGDLPLHKKGPEELAEYTGRVLDFLKFNADNLGKSIRDYDLEAALRFEDAIDEMRDQLNKISRRKMAKKKRSELKGELIFRDIVRHLEHIGDYSLNISQALRLAD
ncbi:Na/Pi cotransporter family protein [Marispirochaeta aestuarii]|uniref:Na/Pi cotransporter family protein n=1 Tax=Marispirochaeta aestuarii TaxID=1963862 RepID=UPI0029C940FA|nr:Na/Pi cotransporter family protein [Marispirochaeta aestuarii]